LSCGLGKGGHRNHHHDGPRTWPSGPGGITLFPTKNMDGDDDRDDQRKRPAAPTACLLTNTHTHNTQHNRVQWQQRLRQRLLQVLGGLVPVDQGQRVLLRGGRRVHCRQVQHDRAQRRGALLPAGAGPDLRQLGYVVRAGPGGVPGTGGDSAKSTQSSHPYNNRGGT